MYDQSVIVKIGNVEYRNFQKLYVRKSLDELCHYLEMDIAQPVMKKKDNDKEEKEPEIERHKTVEVYYEFAGVRHQVTTIEIDTVSRVLTSERSVCRVSGRSPARNIVDSSWSEQLKQQTLLQVLKHIAARFGMKVKSYNGDGGHLEAFEWENESPWQKLATAAMAHECLIYSSQAGNLYLNNIAKSARKEGFSLVENENVEEISIEEDGSVQFGHYIMLGEHGNAEARDGNIGGKAANRVMTINMSDSSMSEQELQRYARVQMLRRRSRKLKVRLAGWGLTRVQMEATKQLAAVKAREESDEKEKSRIRDDLYGFETLWEPNFYVPIKMDGFGFGFESALLTNQVEYSVEDDAISCNVSLVPREDYIGST